MTVREPEATIAGSNRAVYSSFALLFALGLGLQMLLWSRQWIYGDQYALLTPAVQYLQSGELAPFSKGMSGGGRIPGGLLQLLVAAPLRLWNDYRAPSLAAGSSQVIALLILFGVTGVALGKRHAVFFTAVYWLSPWRLYHAGFLWEPGFVFLPAALHLGCCWILREPMTGRSGERSGQLGDGSPGSSPAGLHIASLGLGAVLVATLQIHASFVVLVIATAVLLWRRGIRIRPVAAVGGALLAGLTLLPTVMAFGAADAGRVAPEIDRRVALPIMVVSNAGKSLLYWLRMGSVDIGRRLRETAWLTDPPAGTEAALRLPSALVGAVAALTVVSLVVAIWANGRYLRRREADPRSGAAWLRSYVLTMLATTVIAGAVSPVPVQGWHLVIALHAACIPVSAGLLEASDRGGFSRALVVAFVALLVVSVVLIGLGHPMYMRPDEMHVQRQDIPQYLRPLIDPA